MGFGDFDIASQTFPTITTIRVDAVNIGMRTGKLLPDLFDKTDLTQTVAGSGAACVDVGFKLIERAPANRTAGPAATINWSRAA